MNEYVVRVDKLQSGLPFDGPNGWTVEEVEERMMMMSRGGQDRTGTGREEVLVGGAGVAQSKYFIRAIMHRRWLAC